MTGRTALGLHRAILVHGLRLPPRREIALCSGLSEATISRRYRSSWLEERLTVALVSARSQTYPHAFGVPAWAEWLPRADSELDDVRVWSACLSLAGSSSEVADAVAVAWEWERTTLGRALGEDECVLDGVQALVAGLCQRRSVEPGFTHERALAALARVVDALGAGEGRS